MAISANVIFDVRTGGSDTANGGGFDPSVTGGMNADGAATSANTASPVFTSASYNFVAGDVGAWLFIASGTNWTAGWYQIASVAANAATLSAAAGAGYILFNNTPVSVTTADGCATVASPTGATWTIDYSQQDAAQFSYTDLASAGAGLTVSSATTPFDKHMVGNMLVVASGTNFTAGNYIIASIGGSNVATVTGAGNITSGAGASGVGGLGGAMATPGKAGQRRIAGNKLFIKSGTYTMTSTSANVSGGVISLGLNGTAGGANMTVGWDTERTPMNVGTPPTFSGGALSSFVLCTVTGTYNLVRNLVLDGNSRPTSTGLSTAGNNQQFMDIKVMNTTANGAGINGGIGTLAYRIEATGCSGTSAIIMNFAGGAASAAYCHAHDNSVTGIIAGAGVVYRCISNNNTGVTTYGFTSGSSCTVIQSVAYDNDAGGFNTGTSASIVYISCIAEENGGRGWITGSMSSTVMLINCAGHNNTTSDYNAAQLLPCNIINFIAQSAGSFFVDAANDDFNLNDTAGQGALLRSTGIISIPGGTTISYDDIGAATFDGSSGGGGAVNPLNGVIVSR